ncbi:hypothetical protein ACFJIW_12075 [Tahibacter sp. UC22_41]|uniref:hypothetical protein n=1 Tax=Tahibacter sp. UC22_41 TaxID=3350178 RepID=UPI0036D93DD2
MAEGQKDPLEAKISGWLWAPLGGLFAFAMPHTLGSRGLGAAVTNSATIGAALTVVSFILLLIVARQVKGARRMLFVSLPTFFANSVVAGFGVYCYSVLVIDFLVWLKSPGIVVFKAIVVGVITLYFGGMLFLFRLRRRGIYGLTEVLSGVLIAGYRFVSDGGMSDPALFLVILTAGVYLVVRGIDNIHQGLTKEPLDPLATKYCARFLSRAESNK